MPKFVLRPKENQTFLRQLLLVSPLFFFVPISRFISELIFISFGVGAADATTSASSAIFYTLLITAIPATFVTVAMSALYRNRLELTADWLKFDLFSAKKIPMRDLTEVGAEEGHFSNDFRESIKLVFESGEEVFIPIDDYDELRVRTFLSLVKEQRPDCKFTYSDVIPLESRGLLRFLVDSSESSVLTVKLSKTPIEDMVLDLVRNNERFFWIVYGVFWTTVVVSLGYYSFVYGQSTHLAGGAFNLDLSSQAKNFAEQFAQVQKASPDDFGQLAYLSLAATAYASLDFLSTSGIEGVVLLWAFIGLFVGFFYPMLRLHSPTYVFIDQNSVGIGMEFLQWMSVERVRLDKIGEMGDPLEGVLVIHGHGLSQVRVDLTRIADIKMRRRVLRLVERYAVNASFNSEFLRATNAIVDIQFTDIWLADAKPDSKAGTEFDAENASEELLGKGQKKLLRNGTYIIDEQLGFGGQGVTYIGRKGIKIAAAEIAEDVVGEGAVREGTVGAGMPGEGIPKAGSAQVVIKELVLPNFADVRILQDATSRFEHGATLLEKLHHPQIVALSEHFIEDGKAYLVLEYIQGKTLRQVVDDVGPLPVSEVIKVGIQMCDILEYLHSQENAVIHCDFAPDNLIMAPGGTVKLVDFDVARVVDSRSYTFIAGRPSYTPPEQFRGAPTTQSDLFALGAILHFLSKGVDPAPLGGGLDNDTKEEQSDLEKLISLCLSFEPSDRPATASDIRKVLEQIRSDSSDLADSTGFRLKLLEKETI